MMDIHTIEDLLFYLPYRYDVREIKPLAELEHNAQVTIVGEIDAPPQVLYGRKQRTVFNVKIEGAIVRVVMFFRIHASEQRLQRGTVITLTGKWDAHRLQITANSFKLGIPKSKVEIESLYTVKGNVTMGRLRSFIKQALKRYSDQIIEILPETELPTYQPPLRGKSG